MKILGHIVGAGEVKPIPEKVAAVMHYPRSMTKLEVRVFLGNGGYYWKFIPNFSTVACLLFEI